MGGGKRWRGWLRHCATIRKVAGSIRDVIGIYRWYNHCNHNMALKSIQPLKEKSTRDFHFTIVLKLTILRGDKKWKYQGYFLGVKDGSYVGWHPYRLHVPNVLKSGNLNLLESSGSVRACNGIALPFLSRKIGENWEGRCRKPKAYDFVLSRSSFALVPTLSPHILLPLSTKNNITLPAALTSILSS